MESMRVKPVGTEVLDKLECALDDPLRPVPAQRPPSQETRHRPRTTMTPDMMITRISALPPEVETLEASAATEGFNFMTRNLFAMRFFSSRR